MGVSKIIFSFVYIHDLYHGHKRGGLLCFGSKLYIHVYTYIDSDTVTSDSEANDESDDEIEEMHKLNSTAFSSPGKVNKLLGALGLPPICVDSVNIPEDVVPKEAIIREVVIDEEVATDEHSDTEADSLDRTVDDEWLHKFLERCVFVI